MNDIYRSKIVHLRKGNSLQNLQTLQGAFMDKDSPLIDSMYKLINLTKLKMSFLLNLLQQEVLVEGLVKLTLLESLKIKSIDEMASRLLDDPMPELEKLHNLKLLSFYSSSYVKRSMVCSKLGFPQLLILKFWMLPELDEWNVEEQALQNLQ
ncbi:hypothetical protein RGQ29_021507 [Quercus rubra]|uniref:Uncharacterized protein n=1 Tax=Quercus rubra TaxID=3512 RepID=A0AAN7FEV7_QUERU|nr:hypothetical protein RGQ29_021507 [Quercus rubra]